MNNDKIAAALRKSREHSGRSQAYIAERIGVSKKTVQNWEDAYSSPTVAMFLAWFNAINMQPLPYVLDMIYPETEDLVPGAPDSEIDAALISIVKNLSPELKKKLLFILYGNHGSSPSAVIEMATAHLHAPLRDRLNIAQGILNNYEIAQACGTDVAPENAQPELSVFKTAIYNARTSICNSENSYTIRENNNED